MAATVTTPYLESAAWVLVDEADEFPKLLRCLWRAHKLADGSLADVVTETVVTVPDPFGQAEWDDIWDGALTLYTSVYANSPVAPPADPIVIP